MVSAPWLDGMAGNSDNGLADILPLPEPCGFGWSAEVVASSKGTDRLRGSGVVNATSKMHLHETGSTSASFPGRGSSDPAVSGVKCSPTSMVEPFLDLDKTWRSRQVKPIVNPRSSPLTLISRMPPSPSMPAPTSTGSSFSDMADAPVVGRVLPGPVEGSGSASASGRGG